MQPIGAQELNEGLILQYVLVREDDEMGEKNVEWCTGTVVKFSNGSNLQTQFSTGPKYFRKGGTTEVRWHENTDDGESKSYSIVTFLQEFIQCRQSESLSKIV